MDTERIIRDFASLTSDAVGLGLRLPEDDSARMIWVNPRFTEVFGWTPEEIIGQSVDLVLDPARKQSLFDQVRPAFDRGERHIRGEGWAQRKDGSHFWASLSITVPEEQPDVGHLSFAVYRDLTDLKERELSAERALAERQSMLEKVSAAQERLMSAINTLPGPVAIWDRDFRLVVCNSAFSPRLLAKDEPPPVGTPLEDVLHAAAHSGQFLEALGNETRWRDESIAAIRSGPISDITHYTDGRSFHAISTLTANGDTLILSSDITEMEHERTRAERYAKRLEEVNAEIRKKAFQDALTGLGNRRYLDECLGALIEERRVNLYEIAVIQIDLDRFKQINDTLGHAAGDHVLVTVADRLRGAVREDDIVARIGGDEFVVLTRCDPEGHGSRALARRILDALCRSVSLDGKELRMGGSVGIARTPTSLESELLTDADIALYKSKRSGRRRISEFQRRDRDEMRAAKALADDLMRGIEQDELLPWFQVQVDAGSGRVVALEALIRWDHPRHGILAPERFLPIAEDLNLLGDIDRRIFEKSLELMDRAFPAGDAPGLCLNVSDARLMSPEMRDCAHVARNSRFKVAFELLETIYLDDESEAVMMQIDTLREMGLSIELDDFGSGRASIVALQRIAPDRLKIDRRLVAPITSSGQSLKLVRSIVEIGNTLGIGVTAEGVETKRHRKLLRDIGCDRLQGFLFGKPAPIDRLCARHGIGSGAGARNRGRRA